MWEAKVTRDLIRTTPLNRFDARVEALERKS